MTLRERLGLSGPVAGRCACQERARHYGETPCAVDVSEVPLGPDGYCWVCWTARHDQPTDDRPAWLRRMNPHPEDPVVANRVLES